jgi:hypothetical protein
VKVELRTVAEFNRGNKKRVGTTFMIEVNDI